MIASNPPHPSHRPFSSTSSSYPSSSSSVLNVDEKSMLDEQLYRSFLLPASLFSKVTLNQFGGGPKAQAVNLAGGF